MKKVFSYVACASLLLSGCEGYRSLSPGQQDAIAKVGEVTLNLLQFAADVAVQVVVSRAGSPADIHSKAGLLYSAANGLRTLQAQTDGLVTPELVSVTVRQFTNPDKKHWGELATSLSAAYAASDQSSDVKLEALALGLDHTAGSFYAQP